MDVIGAGGLAPSTAAALPPRQPGVTPWRVSWSQLDARGSPPPPLVTPASSPDALTFATPAATGGASRVHFKDPFQIPVDL
jgi:hypothetical protein